MLDVSGQGQFPKSRQITRRRGGFNVISVPGRGLSRYRAARLRKIRAASPDPRIKVVYIVDDVIHTKNRVAEERKVGGIT